MNGKYSGYIPQTSKLGDPMSMISTVVTHHEVKARIGRSSGTGRRRVRPLLTCLTFCTLVSTVRVGTAQAQTKASAPDLSSQPAAQSPELQRALGPLSWKKTPGQGVALGMEAGLWGKSLSQGLRVTVPFSRYFGVALRGLYLIDMTDEGPFTADAGGRFEVIGRSDVFFNVLRLYGGGGVQVLAPAANTAGREVQVGGGGQFGFEFFQSPYCSFFLEVGGQGGLPSPGATVLAGMMFYPWTR